MTAQDVVNFLAMIGEGTLWTLLIIVVFLFIVSSRADKE